MEIFKTQNELKSYLQNATNKPLKKALVPTMGALHEGHLALIAAAKKQADITICSIFVNPTQFNDPTDLEKYPKPIEQDIALLQQQGCDVLFLPTVEEMYPSDDLPWSIDLGTLDTLWEGAKRPGHFQGVTQIVYKLFRLVEPDVAFFGQKDFQQVMVIQRMIDLKQLPIEIIIHPIVRNAQGLALSSRNARLSPVALQKATALYQALQQIKNNFTDHSIAQLTHEATATIEAEPALQLEYLAICETRTLQAVDTIEADKKYVALVVAWIEGVRLIDNMLLN